MKGKVVTRYLKRLQDLSKIERGWLGDGQGEQVANLARSRAQHFVSMCADLADLFSFFPTEEGGISLEFDKGGWSFAVEFMPDGSVEIDGSSKDGDVFEVQSFNELSQDFFEAFDRMTSVVFSDRN